jgi:hypothetical protein
MENGREKWINIFYNSKKIVDSQITEFRPFLDVKTLEKPHLLKRWHVTVEN